MQFSSLFFALAALSSSNAAIPALSGYTSVWSDDFVGASKAAPSSTNWDHYTLYPNANAGEVQHYTSSTTNSYLNGDGRLMIVPTLSNGVWSSARLHGKKSFTCPLGKKMRIQAEIFMGSNAASTQQGIWPAFWALGQSWRASSPVKWPACGEWDVAENRNGVATGFGTLHCDKAPGGYCNEYNGLGATVNYGRGAWHTWSFEVDRTNTNAATWKTQSMSWYLDGVKYKTVTGADVTDLKTWTAVARSPFFLIFNVAVGGDFPGAPNTASRGGLGAGMEVRYVAVYNSN